MTMDDSWALRNTYLLTQSPFLHSVILILFSILLIISRTTILLRYIRH
jgi:hypothetical protein